MKITIIGHWGAYPEADSATSSLLVEQDNFSLLVECGSGVLAQVQQYISLEQLDAVFLSHYHHDHVADLGVLQYAMLIQHQLGKRQVSLPIYAHQEDQQKFESLTYEEYTQSRAIQAGKVETIGPWQASFCPTVHPAYCLALKLDNGRQSMVYTADTEWSEELIHFSRGADLLIADCSLYSEQLGQIGGHLTAGEVGKLAALAQVKRVVLTHLPHYGQHERLIQQAREHFAGEIILAQSGQSLTIPPESKEYDILN